MTKKVAVHTLGCKVNQYESQAIIEMFEKKGYIETDFDDVADVYIINTCTVTGISDRKSRQMIRRAKKINPDSVVIVAGCYSQTEPEKVSAIEGVNIVVGTKDRDKIVELAETVNPQQKAVSIVSDIMKQRQYEKMSVTGYSTMTRAYVKVQDGCDRFCTYCKIPYARGPVRSREVADVIAEVTKLAENGFLEIVVTGIHVASYGKDLKNTDLISLLEEINKIEKVKRIRMSSVEPVVVTDDFVMRASELDKLQHHFHLALQSGCDETLKRMGRRYTTDEFYEAVCKIRNAFPDAGITTDLMVGFNGETDEEFDKTCEFIKKVGFSQIHIFKYSPREGTKAEFLPDPIPGEIKDSRSKTVEGIADELHRTFAERFVGNELEVFVEEKIGENVYEGKTGNYLTVRIESDKDIELAIIKVKPSKFKNGALVAVY